MPEAAGPTTTLAPTLFPIYTPEESPFKMVMVDVTHRCNMECRNCYLPNRTVPDLDAQWLSTVFARLPRGTQVRLVGAEPTLREDLPQIIRDVRRHGHHAINPDKRPEARRPLVCPRAEAGGAA